MKNISDMAIYSHEIKVKILNLNVSKKFRFSNKLREQGICQNCMYFMKELLKIGFIHNFYDKAQMGYMKNVSS
jgi:hypothetical protein